MKKTLGLVAFCLTSAYVALLPQFYLVYDQGNRYTLEWSPRARASILIAIGLLAATYGLLYAALLVVATGFQKWQKKTKPVRMAIYVAVWVMTALLFRSIMAIACATEQIQPFWIRLADSNALKIFCYALLPGGSLLFRPESFVRIVLNTYRVLAALCALFFIQLFLWNTYSAGDTLSDIPSKGDGAGGGDGLYIFLFDEWSYDDTFGNPEFSIENMPHLKELLRHSTLFTNAYSPGVMTTVSIPRFLYQTDERIRTYSHSELEARVEGNDFLSLDLKSIFDLSDQHFKFVLGTFIYYQGILGKKVDFYMPFYSHNTRYSLRDRVLNLLYSQLAFLRKFGMVIPPPVEPLGWMFQEFQARIRPVLADIFPKLPDRNIAFVHMCLPHDPFLYRRDWTPIPHPVSSDAATVEDYLENVYAMDAVLGDIIGYLKARGDYESSMILLLSDHARKKTYSRPVEELDLDRYVPEKHVPLIIKYPGQMRGGQSGDPLVLTELHPLFNDHLNAPDKVARWVEGWNAGSESQALYAPKE